MCVVVYHNALGPLLEVERVLQLRLATVPAVLRAALEGKLVAAGTRARVRNENHKIRVVPRVLWENIYS